MKLPNIAPETAATARVRPGPLHPHPLIPSYTDQTAPALSARFRRPAERWAGIELARRMAEIIILRYGGYSRPIIHRGSKHLRSKLCSRKTGVQQITEGRGHCDLAKYNEVCPDVLDYQAHPFMIRFQLEGRPKVYYPDHIRLLRDGTIELIEVKGHPRDLNCPDYRAKLAAVAEICRRCGWTFRVLFHAEIAGPRWRMQNVEAIHLRRFTIVSRLEQSAISAFVASGEAAEWGRLRERVVPGNRIRGDAVLQNAVALGRINLDLDARITDATLVHPVDPVRHNGVLRGI